MKSNARSKAAEKTENLSGKSRKEEVGNEQSRRVFGYQETREEVMVRVRENQEIYGAFCRLTSQLQEEFISFCMGVRGLNVTYDKVFKSVFDPVRYPERLEDFLKRCLKRDLKILEVLPNESARITQEGSLLVMDIIVRLMTGEVANVEIQRIGYLFPGQRCACYSSDLVMRQYSKVRLEKKNEGKPFSYQDIKTVYTIVLIEQSTEEFKKLPGNYLHYSRQVFDTGLELDMVQEYLLIPLDIFMETRQNISSKLDAWLYFIASDAPEDILKVIEAYPEFEEIYRQVFEFRFQMKELMSMFSEALSILDKNTAQYMIDLQREEIERNKEEIKRQMEEIQRQKEETQRQKEEAQRQTEEIQRQKEEARRQKEENQRQAEEIERLKALLGQRGENVSL